MSRIKFDDFYTLFQERVSNQLSSQEITKHKYDDGISSIVMSKKSPFAFMGSIDGSLLAFDLESREIIPLYRISGNDAEITSLAITNDDKYLIFGSSNSSIGVYHWPGRTLRYVIQRIHQGRIAIVKQY